MNNQLKTKEPLSWKTRKNLPVYLEKRTLYITAVRKIHICTDAFHTLIRIYVSPQSFAFMLAHNQFGICDNLFNIIALKVDFCIIRSLINEFEL